MSIHDYYKALLISNYGQLLTIYYKPGIVLYEVLIMILLIVKRLWNPQISLSIFPWKAIQRLQ